MGDSLRINWMKDGEYSLIHFQIFSSVCAVFYFIFLAGSSVFFLGLGVLFMYLCVYNIVIKVFISRFEPFFFFKYKDSSCSFEESLFVTLVLCFNSTIRSHLLVLVPHFSSV